MHDLFRFENHQLRIQLGENNEPWFNANDVCEVLGYANSRDALSNHVDNDDVARGDTIDSLGRTQQANFINESGLYALIFGSTKESAKQFKKWVTKEVLPSIRKTGAYSAEDKLKTLSTENQILVNTLLENAALKLRQDEQAKQIADNTQSIREIQAEQSAYKDGVKYFTVVGYCNLNDIRVTEPEAQLIGKRASKLSRQNNITIDYTSHSMYGKVNKYHESMLDIAVEDFFKNK